MCESPFSFDKVKTILYTENCAVGRACDPGPAQQVAVNRVRPGTEQH